MKYMGIKRWKMKFAIICYRKSKVRLYESSNSNELMSMSIALMQESINKLVTEKKISEKEAKKVVKELLDESILKY